MKSILLICPSNKLYMPYLLNYTKVFEKHDICYETVIWNRMGFAEKADFVFEDKKHSYQKGLFGYLKYTQFIRKILKNKKYDKIIVFGLQLSFFLKDILLKEYKDNYIIDVRDYNKILKISSLKKVLNCARFVVISSHKYTCWLPTGDNYVLNHNMSLESFEPIERKMIVNKNRYNISYIGTIVNLKMNIELIEEFKDSTLFELRFIGAGMINADLREYVEKNNIKNVEIIGKYEKHEEEMYFNSSDFMNMFMETNPINAAVLSNRLYNAALYGLPLIAIDDDSLISRIIKEYKLGLVVSEINGLSSKLTEYIKCFDENEFLEGRSKFLKKVITDNQCFQEKLIEIIESSDDCALKS